MKNTLFISSLALCNLLSGCVSQHAEPTPKLQHALLLTPNQNEVNKVINTLMNMQNITLDDDVFTINSVFTLSNLNENNIIKSHQLNPPDQFELMIKNKQCFIRHVDSKATQELKGVECVINE
jgi:hydroxymethylpyrimidine/phosphomethylpyrimidine kinase